jgi:hypothetical protein
VIGIYLIVPTDAGPAKAPALCKTVPRVGEIVLMNGYEHRVSRVEHELKVERHVVSHDKQPGARGPTKGIHPVVDISATHDIYVYLEEPS